MAASLLSNQQGSSSIARLVTAITPDQAVRTMKSGPKQEGTTEAPTRLGIPRALEVIILCLAS